MRILYKNDNVTVSSFLRNNSTVTRDLKSIQFAKIKDDILGKKYDLSIVLVGKARSRFLNSKYRKKDKPADILSFPITDSTGEIIICPEIARKKAVKFFSDFKYEAKSETEITSYLLFLVIHGAFHLKGMDHGVKMTQYERSYYSRYRRRYL
jgi:rRNA maturation RNase YbeY